jgi:VanZ family protein
MRAIDHRRLVLCFVLLGLIVLSSSTFGGVSSDVAYKFYHKMIFPLFRHAAPARLYLVAEKGVHFLLFAALGFWIYNTLFLSHLRRLWISIIVCAAVGIASEYIQRFTGRDPLVGDAVLNVCSGILGAFIALRAHRKNSSAKFNPRERSFSIDDPRHN